MTWGGMGGSGSRPSAGRGRDPDRGERGGSGAPGGNAGWSIFSYLLAGMIVYGGLGWLIARWTGHSLIFPIGMFVGLALGIAGIMYRYGRS
jgi:F0F1-type ATP synthase assembly protein I